MRHFASREAFIIGIKFPPTDHRRFSTFTNMVSRQKVLRNGLDLVEWSKIRQRSDAIFSLIESAITVFIQQNDFLSEVLCATAGLKLVPDLVSPESPNTSLPAEVFLKTLEKLRAEHV